MTSIGKLVFACGCVLAALGAVLWMLGRAGLKGLPGDIRVDTGSLRLYFPIVTCIVLSAVLTLGMWIWNAIGRK